MTAITFIGFGEAGGIFASELARDHAVTVWDCKLSGAEREPMLAKARQAGVRAAGSLAEALEGAALVFSTVTAGSALDVAQQAAPLLTAGAIFSRSQLGGASDQTPCRSPFPARRVCRCGGNGAGSPCTT